MGNLYNPFALVAQVKYAWKFYDVKQDQNPPVQNTVYDLLVGTGGIQVLFLVFAQENTETDNKDIDVIITVDGETTLYDASAEGGQANAVNYGYVLDNNTVTLDGIIYPLNLGAVDPNFTLRAVADVCIPLEGTDVTIQYRMTSAAGTAQRLRAKIWYLALEAV